MIGSIYRISSVYPISINLNRNILKNQYTRQLFYRVSAHQQFLKTCRRLPFSRWGAGGASAGSGSGGADPLRALRPQWPASPHCERPDLLICLPAPPQVGDRQVAVFCLPPSCTPALPVAAAAAPNRHSDLRRFAAPFRCAVSAQLHRSLPP